MLVVAGVAAVDTRADELRIAHDLPVLPAVATLRRGPVELRILAASHQVVVDGDGGPWVETVACGTGVGEWLRDGRTVTAGGTATTVEVAALPAGAFAAEVAAWRRRGREDDRALVVEFPGRDAVTGLALAPTGERWVSLHSYPGPAGGGTVVRTRTVLGAREALCPA
ncbi:MAG TPA: DUF2617 family protein [Acidimicrobiales bacterium]